MRGDSSMLDGVTWGRISRVCVAKLKMNVDLVEGILEVCRSEGIRTGVILNCFGALDKGVFRNPIRIPPDFKMTDKDRLYEEVNKPMEVVSLVGWVATKDDGKLEMHGHFSASLVVDGKTVVLGGHLGPGNITSIKIVVIIGVIEDSPIKAALDPNINQVNLFF